MRLLADENIARAAVLALRAAGHDVAWCAESQAGAADRDVLGRATVERRTVLTHDRDFGSLVFVMGQAAPFGVMYLRFDPGHPAEAAELFVRSILEPAIAVEGRFVVVERESLRVRPVPGEGRKA